MKFTVNKADFEKAITPVSVIAQNKSAESMLHGIYIVLFHFLLIFAASAQYSSPALSPLPECQYSLPLKQTDHGMLPYHYVNS